MTSSAPGSTGEECHLHTQSAQAGSHVEGGGGLWRMW
jgi:hypothetical protein